MIRNTSKALQRWSGRFVGSVGLQLVLAKEVVHGLEMMQDRRLLSDAEWLLMGKLKIKALGLAWLE